jgi:hypothetical protein
MIMSLHESADRAEGSTPTNVELLNFALRGSDNRSGKALKGGAKTRRSRIMMKARLYRLALVAGVVAVFLEGLGASFKWG